MKTTYVEKRDRVIAITTDLCNQVYPNDGEMMEIAMDLTTQLMVADNNEDFINGMLGFILWADSQRQAPTKSSVFTTLIHDLGEFSKHRNEGWFAPRTSRYQKYLTGASEVEH